jgi:hypothetical protein
MLSIDEYSNHAINSQVEIQFAEEANMHGTSKERLRNYKLGAVLHRWLDYVYNKSCTEPWQLQITFLFIYIIRSAANGRSTQNLALTDCPLIKPSSFIRLSESSSFEFGPNQEID